MDTQRITITIPGYIYNKLKKVVPKRGISKFVADSVEKQLLIPEEDPVEAFFKMQKELQKSMPKKPSMKDILAAIDKGRM